MGIINASYLEHSARHLVRVLRESGGRVHFGRFYDGTPETRQVLVAGIRTGDWDGSRPGAELVFESAVAVMEAQGYVTRVWLDEELADGLPAYVIELTAGGRQRLAAGDWPEFKDLDS